MELLSCAWEPAAPQDSVERALLSLVSLLLPQGVQRNNWRAMSGWLLLHIKSKGWPLVLWVDLLSLQTLSGMRVAAVNGCARVSCEQSREPSLVWSGSGLPGCAECSYGPVSPCLFCSVYVESCLLPQFWPAATSSGSWANAFWFLTAPKWPGSSLKLLWQCNYFSSVFCSQHTMARQLPVLSEDSWFEVSCQLLISRETIQLHFSYGESQAESIKSSFQWPISCSFCKALT